MKKVTDKVRLQHILEAANDITEIFEDGTKDKKSELAIQKLIEIIGEASTRLSPELKAKYPNVPWANIIGMRNYLVHEYFRVHKPTIWDVAEHKIPALRDWITGIIENLEED